MVAPKEFGSSQGDMGDISDEEEQQEPTGTQSQADNERDSSRVGSLSLESKPSLLKKGSLVASRSASTDLRFELEQQRVESEKHKKKNQQKAFSFYGLEAKTLNFAQLAFENYGDAKSWGEISREEQARIIREALTSKVFLINPLSTPMKIFDLVVVCCLLFTAIVTPYECAFLELRHMGLYVINWMVTSVFIVDMLLQFFLKVKKTTKQGSIMLRSRKLIAYEYIKTWFVIDILSVIPYDDIAEAANSEEETTTMENLKMLRLIRVMRLIKLVRMFKASRLLKRWENSVSLSSAHMYLIKFAALVSTSMHWMACLWGVVGTWEGTNLKCAWRLQNDDPRLSNPEAAYYIRQPSENEETVLSLASVPDAWVGYSWTVAFAGGRAQGTSLNPCNPFDLYIVSLYWAVMTMTSIGYGDITPQVLSEYIVCNACMIVGSVLWAYLIGAASAILSNMYPEETMFEQRLDAFNVMVREEDMPQDIRHRGREYLREARFHAHYQRNLEAIRGLGADLSGFISRQQAAHLLDNIWFFANASLLFRGDCAAKMQPYFFEPREVINLPEQLCVMERGAVGCAGRVLVPWGYWGEDFIVSCDALRIKIPTVALTYAVVVSLTRDDVNTLLLGYPEERAAWRRAAACVATMRAVRIYRKGRSSGEINEEDRWVHDLFDGVVRGSHRAADISSMYRGKTIQIGDAAITLESRMHQFLDRVENMDGPSLKPVVWKDSDSSRDYSVSGHPKDEEKNDRLAAMQAQLDRMEVMFLETMTEMKHQMRSLGGGGDATASSSQCWR